MSRIRHSVIVAVAAVLSSLAGRAAWAQQAYDSEDTPPTVHVTASEPPPGGRADLSHINGVPIPVGTHNEYYYTFKRWNVSSNPVGWVMGSYGVSVSYGLGQNVALRGDLDFYKPVGSGAAGYELGVGLPIYFRRTYQGLFLEPGLIVRELGDGDYRTEEKGPQVLVGWHWSWDSGLNFAIALGVGRNLANKDGNYNGGDELFPNGYMRFGYEF